MTVFWDVAMSRPDDGGSKHLWEAGQLLLDYTAHPRMTVIFILAGVRTWSFAILKWIVVKIGYDCVDWIHLVHEMDQCAGCCEHGNELLGDFCGLRGLGGGWRVSFTTLFHPVPVVTVTCRPPSPPNLCTGWLKSHAARCWRVLFVKK
jgi:hypothetical protein